MICIYKIVVTGGVYVGQTSNFRCRSRDHLSSLTAGRHYNSKLQELFSSDPSSCKIEVIEELESTQLLNEKEKYWIKECGTLNIVGLNELPIELETAILNAANYFISNKVSTLPEAARLFEVPKETLYNIKRKVIHHYMYIKYPQLVDFYNEPTRTHKGRGPELIESYQNAIIEMSTFRWKSTFLKTKYSLGTVLSDVIVNRSRFEEILIPDILYSGIEYMGKYSDCANDRNILLIEEAIKLKKSKDWGYQKITTHIGGPSAPTMRDMVECISPKWKWLKILRPEIWEDIEL